ncbi:hypothetical protein [Staphylococcus epidermidis]|uniref:hypothetical protein n=1 Tax=Staphylococcus epidermidis TaxID=1282 RepID=UPI00164273AE|nr:hypothetical protein [Staphylococcus epidermidis]
MGRWLKDNCNSLGEMMILGSVLFVLLGGVGGGFGGGIGLGIGRGLDKNKK